MELPATVSQLPHLIFCGNEVDAKLDVKLGGLSDAKDLFHFWLDILTKGIVMLYGGPERRVSLGDLGADRIQKLAQKLANAGVVLKVVSEPVSEEGSPPSVSFDVKGPAHLLSSYFFCINSADSLIRISFDLMPARFVSSRKDG